MLLGKKYDSDNYEIIEHNRCSAYFECKEIGNLRRKCENVSNKSYREISAIPLAFFCEPAQAGIILSTHKLRETLIDFSKQTEKQYLSNKEMMEQNACESTKQFRITTWMTILVIILTIVNTVPALLNLGGNNYFDQLTGIESELVNIKTNGGLTRVENKIDANHKALYDGYKLTYEKLTTLENRADEIEATIHILNQHSDKRVEYKKNLGRNDAELYRSAGKHKKIYTELRISASVLRRMCNRYCKLSIIMIKLC